MTTMKTSLLSIACAAMLVSVAAHRSQAALVVTNGNFQNLSGLTPLGGVWYGGVPTGWTGVNTNFTVRELDPAPSGNYAANLNALTSTNPTFSPLYQAVGTLPSTSIVSLTFELIPLIAPTTMGASIFNTNNSSSYNDWSLLVTPGEYSTAGSYTLATSVPISAGTPIGIAFWQGGGSGGAPAVDNVVVVPEPSSAMLLLASAAGLGGFAAVRRRR
jgi:hypothetical protein